MQACLMSLTMKFAISFHPCRQNPPQLISYLLLWSNFVHLFFQSLSVALLTYRLPKAFFRPNLRQQQFYLCWKNFHSILAFQQITDPFPTSTISQKFLNVYSYSVSTPMFQHLQTVMPCSLRTVNPILRKLLSIIRLTLIVSIGLLIRINLRYSSHLIWVQPLILYITISCSLGSQLALAYLVLHLHGSHHISITGLKLFA